MRFVEKSQPKKVKISSLNTGDVFRHPSGNLYMVVEVRGQREVVLLEEGFAVDMYPQTYVEPVSGAFVED